MNSLIQKPSSKRQGITLLDLILTISVMGVMAAVAVPKMTDAHQSYQLQVTSRMLSQTINQVRETAIRQSCWQSVTFNLEDEICTAIGIADPDHPTQQFEFDCKEQSSVLDLATVSLTNSSLTLYYNHYGVPMVDTSGTVLTTNGEITMTNGTQTQTIIIDQQTGIARVL